jgi:hypothetical protein
MSKQIHIGKLGKATLSAMTPVIVGFEEGQTLDFATVEEACGFLAFYNQSRTARTQNMAKVYVLEESTWKEKYIKVGRPSGARQTGS